MNAPLFLHSLQIACENSSVKDNALKAILEHEFNADMSSIDLNQVDEITIEVDQLKEGHIGAIEACDWEVSYES